MEKMIVQSGAAALTGVVSEYVEKKALLGATVSGGLVTSLAAAALGYFMAPTARGDAAQMAAGAVDGAATWLAIKYVAPLLGTGFRGPRPAFVPQARMGRVAGGVSSRGVVEI